MRPARYCQLFLSAMATDFLSGPKPFLRKVLVKSGRKLQESGFRLPVPLESMSRAGVPDTTSWQDFYDPVFPSVIRQASDEARVLYFVNSAQPYTVSGYTVRTQKLLHELRRQDVAVYPATRM